jgi:hypothetical protein
MPVSKKGIEKKDKQANCGNEQRKILYSLKITPTSHHRELCSRIEDYELKVVVTLR